MQFLLKEQPVHLIRDALWSSPVFITFWSDTDCCVCNIPHHAGQGGNELLNHADEAMKMQSTPRIKICCIMSREEASAAIDAGANALGLVARMPSGPGVILDEVIADIVRSVPPGISTFLLTCERSVDAIVAHHRRVLTSTIQIVDSITAGLSSELRDRLPGIKIVQVIHVTGERSIIEATAAAQFADALLLDSGRPDLAVKELGGTGRTHNWDVSRKIRDVVGVPVFLAGGLHPGNVREAIETVQPFGVDVCSGVRSNGRLDPVTLEAFVAAVRC